MTRHRPRSGLLLLACLLTTMAPAALAADEPFYLKNGDRVVFYGDSITDQRLYTTFTETFVVTRFPMLDVSFVHSGWGGDRVTGGGGGKIDKRLERDVFAYSPTVVTVMLGMNDASYRAFTPSIFETYCKGYEHIVASVKDKLPGVRMTLIQPSPFDDVTRKPSYEGGYNGVLTRYGEFVKELASKNGLDVADLNTPVVEATKKAFESDPKGAEKLNPDRVHPGPGGQLLMAAALLKAWKAPALVSKVTLSIKGNDVSTQTDHSRVTDVALKDGDLSWTEADDVLPFPINLKDSVVELAVRSSDVVESLDRQPLIVRGLDAGDYALKIDREDVGTFTADQLAEGVNLATLATPMAKQAAEVHQLTLKHNNIHFFRWRTIQVPYQSEDPDLIKQATDAFDAIEAKYVKEQRAVAQPKPHKFELSRKAK